MINNITDQPDALSVDDFGMKAVDSQRIDYMVEVADALTNQVKLSMRSENVKRAKIKMNDPDNTPMMRVTVRVEPPKMCDMLKDKGKRYNDQRAEITEFFSVSALKDLEALTSDKVVTNKDTDPVSDDIIAQTQVVKLGDLANLSPSLEEEMMITRDSLTTETTTGGNE